MADEDYNEAETALGNKPITHFSFTDDVLLYRRNGVLYVRGDDRIEKRILKGSDLSTVNELDAGTDRGKVLLDMVNAGFSYSDAIYMYRALEETPGSERLIQTISQKWDKEKEESSSRRPRK